MATYFRDFLSIFITRLKKNQPDPAEVNGSKTRVTASTNERSQANQMDPLSSRSVILFIPHILQFHLHICTVCNSDLDYLIF